MIEEENILIIKHGALGDVVRTSYFAKPIKLKSERVRLFWLTSPLSAPLLRFNPFIDVISLNADELVGIYFDKVYSLDDEDYALKELEKLSVREVVGLRNDSEGRKTYCCRSAYWFDMGLLSQFGKDRADRLKRINEKPHSEIFREIFDVSNVDVNFYKSSIIEKSTRLFIERQADGRVPIGLNAFAGKRWASKALPDAEFLSLVMSLLSKDAGDSQFHLFLLGSGGDREKNEVCYERCGRPENITVINTDWNVLELAGVVSCLKMLITTDSLCLHLAISQCVPTVAFFSATSAAEIENLKSVRKIKSLTEDYCSYRADADNSTITSERILDEAIDLLKHPND